MGIWLLLFVFVLAALFIANQVRSIMPTEIQAIELKVRAIYKINEGYKNLMGLDPSLTRGNWIYRLAQDEMDPIPRSSPRTLVDPRRRPGPAVCSITIAKISRRLRCASRQHSPKPGRLEQRLRLLPRRRYWP